MPNLLRKEIEIFKRIEKAKFLNRLNRFVIQCLAKGKKIKVFLPNPGRLWELLLPGVTVYFEKSPNINRKLPFTAIAIEREMYPVFINTQLTNYFVELLIQNDLIPGLEGARVQQREYSWGRSRFDFLLNKKEREIILEVKSCTLYGKYVAMFPDAVTRRGKKHIQELRELAKQGKAGAILFLIFSPTAQYFLPDYHTDPEFAQELFQAKEEISIFPVAIKFQKHFSKISQVRTLPVPWSILAKENHNRGAYILILYLPARKSLLIGSLGLVHFPAGYYLYVGSAKKNLEQRISRHKRQRKKPFWHIDYFLEHAQFYKSLPFRTSSAIECDLARALSKISSWEIPRFGSSDCSCNSHLFGIKKDPLQNENFNYIWQYFRMDRIFSN
ncbi:MAG: DNA/RNA nuclease SfsA [Thermodesulfobacteriota bacterium]